MFTLLNIIAFILSVYVIYTIVEMCKSQYYTMESFININNDKNWVIIIFRQIVFIITAILLCAYIHSLQYNHPVKPRKFAKIVPI
jgi:hypothetical protein